MTASYSNVAFSTDVGEKEDCRKAAPLQYLRGNTKQTIRTYLKHKDYI